MRSLFLLPSLFAVAVSTGYCASGDFVGTSSPFTVEKTTQVPGDTLKAGAYSISIVEQISDRMIIRIDSTTGKDHAIFLGVPSTSGKIGGNAPGLVNWATGVHNTPTPRGFVFPDGNVVEFVYPKAEAAELAKVNGTPVVAIDPGSEGRVALKSLSHDELQIVNLWLLSLTSTGVDNKTPAVLARHYDPTKIVPQPTVASSTFAPIYPLRPKTVAPPVVSAEAVRPAPVAPVAPPVPATTIARSQPAPQAVPAAKRVPVVRPVVAAPTEVATLEQPAMPRTESQPSHRTMLPAQLPHTAGSFALVQLLGLLSFLGAGLLGFGRLRSTRRIVS